MTFHFWTGILTKKPVIFSPQKYRSFTKESYLKKKKNLHFYLRCIFDNMFNPLNQNLFFITYLFLQKNLTIVQCISYKLLTSLSHGMEEILFNSPSVTYDSLFKYLRLGILLCTWN